MTQRFVQLPTDTERSAASEFEAASSASRQLDLPGVPGDAELLGAIVALLHRYTQQATISVDVFIREGTAERKLRRLAVDLAVEHDAPVSSVIQRAQAALAGSNDGPVSNVAVSLDVRPGVAWAPASYDAHFALARTGEKPLLAISYNARLLRESTIHRLVDSCVVLMEAASRDPATAVERLPLLSPAELRALTVEQDSGTASYPPLPIHRLFQAMAKRQPEAVAASFQGQRITYAELDARSSQVAHHLVTSGVGPEVPVAVCVRPSLHVLVAMLGIWKARGIYLPLDPTHPETLIGRMLDEAQPRLVLTTSDFIPLTARFPQLCFDTDAGARLLANQPAGAPENAPSFGDPAYLFYTSGTTGKPKGVVATQGNLAHYIHAAARKYGFSPADVFVSMARYTFSISLWELLSPLCCGGSLRILERDDVLTPERLFRALEEVTVLHAGPSLLGSLFRHLRPQSRTLPRMRHASSGGDLVPPAVMEEMKRVFPGAELFVIYGCTEISCMGTTYPIRRDVTAGRTFVGKPFPDVTVRVLDPNRGLVPFGAVGEICFAGEGITRGYLGRPDLTAEKFVELEGRRFYLTGDMGRLHPDGNL
ncbi:MAG TPA: AMP-binding protein, partial [Myxococcales bacterium]|nr:AMP-binding protein [Myxococcales bacterium]